MKNVLVMYFLWCNTCPQTATWSSQMLEKKFFHSRLDLSDLAEGYMQRQITCDKMFTDY